MEPELRELDQLRRRAYGPNADIHDDAAALERLIELEEQLRAQRVPDEDPAPEGQPADAIAQPPARWHVSLVAGTAAVAALLGAVAWAEVRTAPAPPPSSEAGAAVGAAETYGAYIDGLRDTVLALPGAADIAEHMIHDQLTPYGVLYGRTVGAGPTDDDRLCMIIANLPSASVLCIPLDSTDSITYFNALRTHPVSVQLASWNSGADTDPYAGLGEQVSFTLKPDGTVVAVPADPADAPAPTPGTQ